MNIQCPHCETTVKALDEHYGQTVECPSCAGDIDVPVPEPPQTSKTSQSKIPSLPRKKEDKPKTVKPQKNEKSKKYIIPVICQQCKKEIPGDAKKCSYCGFMINSFLLVPVILAICVVIGVIAGIGFFMDSMIVARNAKSAIHEIYGALIALQSLVCLAGSFIILAIINLKQK